MKNLNILTISFLTILALLINCKKKPETDINDLLGAILLYDIYTFPVCSPSDSAQSAKIMVKDNYFSDYNTWDPFGNGSTLRVPAGKKCYFKFVAPTSTIYTLAKDSLADTTTPAVIHIGTANKEPVTMPASTTNFDSEFLFANAKIFTEGSTKEFYFFQKVNSYRIIIADGTKCTSACEIKFQIAYYNERFPYSATTSFSSATSIAKQPIRFDESGVLISLSDSNKFYYTSSAFDLLFVSPKTTVSTFVHTKKTYNDVYTMYISVSDPIDSIPTSFTATSNQSSSTEATITNLSTQAGMARYIKGKFTTTYLQSSYSSEFSNSF